MILLNQMKQIKYILIIIILVVLSSPVFKISAQSVPQRAPLGKCYYSGARRVSRPQENVTEDDCAQQGSSSTAVTWAQNGTEIQRVPQRAPLGDCQLVFNGVGHGHTGPPTTTTEDACAQKASANYSAQWTVGGTEATGGGGATSAVGKTYTLLAPLPCELGNVPGCVSTANGKGQLTTFDPTTGFGAYLNIMIKIFIGICAVLSVVMIVMGGVEYMTSELSHSKEAGKEKIEHALLGLIIALGAYALLFTINPDLLITCISPEILKDGVCVVPGK